MGCLISRPRAPSGNNTKTTDCNENNIELAANGGANDAKQARKSRGRSASEHSRVACGDNCDYASSGHQAAGAIISQSGGENINQTQAPARTTQANTVINLGQYDVANEQELALAQRGAKMSPRSRKRQKQALESKDELSNQAAGSFLFMLVPGRRHSAMRIDAAKATTTSTTTSSLVDSKEQAKYRQASISDYLPNLNFLRPPPPETRASSAKRKLNLSRGQLEQRYSFPVANTEVRLGMVQEAAHAMPHGDTDRLSSGRSEQNSDIDLSPKNVDDALLFTSLQHLCYDILNRKLLQVLGEPPKTSAMGVATREAVVCLFVFGRPGSSKGELAFDLVEHSSLADALADLPKLERLVKEPASNVQELCPLFHYIDVSALIVANIDGRIREYNKLVARTLRGRRHQLALVATRRESEELDESTGADEASDASSVQHHQESSFDSSTKREPSLEGEESISKSKDKENTGSIANGSVEPEKRAAQEHDERRRASLEHQFGIMTLTTKQRSILQLKLMKYSTCVTSKWITILIKQEINQLERRLRNSLAELGKLTDLLARVPQRIYLINLVPNQLSLFKSCLYLEQDLSLADFHRPYYAIKFERRTNIRVLKKERRIKRDQSRESHSLSDATKSFQFKLAHLKIPIITSNSLNKSASHESLVSASRTSEEVPKSLASVSSEVLGSNSNEKLGPKFNECFAEQFANCQRLLRVRFNPLERRPDSCDLKINTSAPCCARWLLAGSGQPTPMPSPTPSSLISMFGSGESKQPQSASFEQLHLTPGVGSSTLSGSSSSSLAELNRAHDNNSVISSTLSAKTQVPKWAIDLQLVRDNEHLVEGASETSQTNGTGRGSGSNQLELLTFQQPRSGSRSPLMFAAADRYQQLLSVSGRHQSSESYALMPTRVAYANGTSQTILEVRRTLRRAVKFKSSQDRARLLKLIERARRQLIEDLENWLAATIVSETCKLHKLNSHSHQDLSALLPAGKRQPSLVTQVIRIDLSEFKGENGCSSLTTPAPPKLLNASPAGQHAQLLQRPVSALDTLRPTLKTRPASSVSNDESSSNSSARQVNNTNRKRHVQFRIEPDDSEGGELALLGPIQRRLWIDECLFASCSDTRLLETMHNFVDLLQGPK